VGVGAGEQSLQNATNENHWITAAREMDNFIVVSDAYPSISAKVADLILPAAMIFEKWGAYGNAERRTQHWRQQVTPIGKSMSDTWQMLEFSKRFTLARCGRVEDRRQDHASRRRRQGSCHGLYREGHALRRALANKEAKAFKWPDPIGAGFLNSEAAGDKRNVEGFKGYGFFLQKYSGRSTGSSASAMPRPRRFRHLPQGPRASLAGGGREGNALEVQRRIRSLCQGGEPREVCVLRRCREGDPRGDLTAQGRRESEAPEQAKIFLRHYIDPPEMPSADYPLWLCTGRVLEHWHTGTMTMRVPELYRAVPEALCYMHPKDAQENKVKDGDLIWLESRRGKVKARVETRGRNLPAAGAGLRAVLRRTGADQQGDARCHLSHLEGAGLQEMRGEDV